MLKKILNVVILFSYILTAPAFADELVNRAALAAKNISKPSFFSFSGDAGSYKLGESTFSVIAPGAFSQEQDGQKKDFNPANTEFVYKIDTRDSAAVLSTNYLLDRDILEFSGAYKWLGMGDQWAGVADVAGSSEFLQLATSHAFALTDESGNGLGVMRFSLAYLEKDMEQSFSLSGKQKYRMPQYNIAAKYVNNFEPIDNFHSEFEGSYNYFYVDGAHQTHETIISDTTSTSSLVGFGGGSKHVAKVWNNFGNDWFKLSGALGLEYTQFESMPDLKLDSKDIASLTTELGGTVNVVEWLQLDGGWKWSDMQSVYKGGVNTDAGPAVVAFEAQKVDNRFAEDDARLGLQLKFPIWDIGSLFKGDFKHAFGGENGKLNHGDDLKLFAHNSNPNRFSRAMADADRVEGSADKVIKVHRFRELQ